MTTIDKVFAATGALIAIAWMWAIGWLIYSVTGARYRKHFKVGEYSTNPNEVAQYCREHDIEPPKQ